jgi:hypothetical protein
MSTGQIIQIAATVIGGAYYGPVGALVAPIGPAFIGCAAGDRIVGESEHVNPQSLDQQRKD